jgi:hypothetical protein
VVGDGVAVRKLAQNYESREAHRDFLYPEEAGSGVWHQRRTFWRACHVFGFQELAT